ncbi:MAG TPA: hypothetical protein VMR25_12745 [Planctomycetaceae bacterium]|jgi:hypothetical protein|nr:hypothetical protein [Planctomycetaceae bacterium]
MNLILVRKGIETYAFYYDEAAVSVASLLETAARFAGDPQLSFDWDDAVGLADAQQKLEAAERARISATPRNATETE